MVVWCRPPPPVLAIDCRSDDLFVAEAKHQPGATTTGSGWYRLYVLSAGRCFLPPFLAQCCQSFRANASCWGGGACSYVPPTPRG